MGFMTDRTHKDFTSDDIQKISNIYHEWRNMGGKYEDIKGFCKSSNIEEIKKHNYVLTAGRYVGIEDGIDDGELFEDKMKKLTEDLTEQMKNEEKMNKEIKEQLKKIGFNI
jgi:type I restriction enzyme M protein